MDVVTFDNTFLCLIFSDKVPIPGVVAGSPEEARVRRQLAHLVESLTEQRSQIIIPTPALSELLMLPGVNLNDILQRIVDQSAFRIVAFDYKAAIELAKMSEPVPGKGKRNDQVGPWTKVKFDRQIVAIAKTTQSGVIYSDDGDIKTLGTKEGLRVVGLNDLPSPPPEAMKLFPESDSGQVG